MDQQLSEETKKETETFLFEGQKIAAIKLVREEARLGLKEAKDLVERIADELYQKYPGRFKAPPSKSGCFSAAAFAFIFITSAILIICLEFYY